MSNSLLQSPFVRRVSGFIQQHQLMDGSGKYLVALSGGADSVALLRVTRLIGYDVEAAHCNFRLRGEESDRDEAFCKQLCASLGIPLHIAHFDTSEYAAAHHLSIEMAARHLRYGYFRQLLADLGAQGVLVAHHRDDSVETVMLNIIRGTGIHGLTGIAPQHEGVIRPLLCVGRDDIVAFLTYIGQDYVTDSTNLVDDVVRNKIRLNILPLMREINPSVSLSIAQMAEKLGQVATVYDEEMGRRAESARVETGDEEVSAYRISQVTTEGQLFHILYPLGFKPKCIEDAFRAVARRNTGASFLSDAYEMVVDRELLFVMPIQKPFKAMRIPIAGRYVISPKTSFCVEELVAGEGFTPSRDPWCATLDAGKVEFPLFLRQVEPGDRFSPLGMKGTKLVSDFLTDQKVNVVERRRQLVVTDAHNHILWLVGRRPAHPCRITPSTSKVLVLRWER